MKFIPFLFLSLTTFYQIQDILTLPSQRLPCPSVNVINGRVKYRSNNRKVRVKCIRNYTLIGAKILTCIGNTWDKPLPACVRPDCEDLQKPRNGRWNFTYNEAVSTLTCDSGYILTGPRTIFCIDGQWNDTIPTCQENVPGSRLSCDFETEDLCGWSQDPSHNFDWTRQDHSTPSGHIGTGPSFDHTLGVGKEGHYMYIESSSRLENDVARLLSPVFGPELSQNACFIFWYHMYGATTGTLRVNVKLLNDSNNIMTIFSKSGEQGQRWLGSLSRLTPVDRPFQIVIEGIRGRGYTSDIAIDDVKLTSGDDCEIDTVPPTEFFIQTTLVTSFPPIAESGTVALRTARPFPTYLPPPPPPPLPPLSPILTVMTSPAPPYPFTPHVSTTPMDIAIEREHPSTTPEDITSDITETSLSVESFPEMHTPKPATIKDESEVVNTTFTIRATTTVTFNTTTGVKNTTSIKTTAATKKTTLSSTRPTTRQPTSRSTNSSTTSTTTLPTTYTSSIKPSPTTTRRSVIVLVPVTKMQWTRTTGPLFISSVIKAPAPSPHTKGIAIISSVVVIVAVFAAVVIFIAARRRIKLNRRNDMAEDSDVRFLTSDEVLDFNLARPAEDDL